MKTNPILELMYQKRNGHYAHVLEVNDVYHLESILSEIYNEFISDYKIADIIDFCTSFTIYCMVDDESDDVYDFDIEQFINQL